jgi:hypothetical protein
MDPGRGPATGRETFFLENGPTGAGVNTTPSGRIESGSPSTFRMRRNSGTAHSKATWTLKVLSAAFPQSMRTPGWLHSRGGHINRQPACIQRDVNRWNFLHVLPRIVGEGVLSAIYDALTSGRFLTQILR